MRRCKPVLLTPLLRRPPISSLQTLFPSLTALLPLLPKQHTAAAPSQRVCLVTSRKSASVKRVSILERARLVCCLVKKTQLQSRYCCSLASPQPLALCRFQAQVLIPSHKIAVAQHSLSLPSFFSDTLAVSLATRAQSHFPILSLIPPLLLNPSFLLARCLFLDQSIRSHPLPPLPPRSASFSLSVSPSAASACFLYVQFTHDHEDSRP